MARIDFNDGAARSFSNGVPAPGNRFMIWRPDPIVVGARHHALGTGIPYIREHRTDYTVYTLQTEIAPNNLEMAQRLKRHAHRGGSVTLFTEDVAGRSYVAYLAEGGEVTISDPNEENLYTVSGLWVLAPPFVEYPVCIY